MRFSNFLFEQNVRALKQMLKRVLEKKKKIIEKRNDDSETKSSLISHH